MNDELRFSIANRDAKCLGLLGGYLSESNWKKYNELLKSNIEEELRKAYPRYKISVDICSAEYKAFLPWQTKWRQWLGSVCTVSMNR